MAKQKKSRGRDLRRTETQAGLDVSRIVEGERGRTNGVEKIGAVSGVTPRLRRKKPSVKRSPNMTAADIRNTRKPRPFYPNELHTTKTGAVKMARYFVDPNTLK